MTSGQGGETQRVAISRRDAMAGGAAFAGTLLSSPSSRALPGSNVIKLRILETTDIHVHVFSHDYYRDAPDDTVGLGRIAALVDKARAGARNTLLFENGDFLQGNPLGDFIAFERGFKGGDLHPIVRAMNQMGFDAGTLGNHEFNYGLDFLAKSLAGAKHPTVCANLVKGQLAGNARSDDTLLRPYVILDREVFDEAGVAHRLRVGVIGFTPPQIMQWDQAHLRGKVDTRDIVESARAWVPEMQERGADVIVALAHSGISTAAPQGRDENAAFHLAFVPGIDVILTGHSHLVFPGPNFKDRPGVDIEKGTLNGVPAVMAGFWGSHLGQIDLTLQKSGSDFKVIGHSVGVLPIFRRDAGKVIPAIDAKPEVLASVQADHDLTLEYVRRPVGRTTRPVDTYFALIADNAALQIISDAQIWYAKQLLAGTPHAALPLLSAVAPFKAGGRSGAEFYTRITEGQVALKNVADLYIYPNTLKAVKVTGQQLKDWLERSSGIFNQIRAGEDEQQLINASFPAFNFDMIDGVTYRIDVSQPSRFDGAGKLVEAGANRITGLAFNGKPVTPQQEFIVVTNNYRASGGGNFPGNDGTTMVLDAPDATRDVIIKYFQQTGALDPKADNNWSLKPVPGARNIVFESSPKGKASMAAIKGLSYAGEAPNGFARYRIDMGSGA
ncbi:MAG: bifunctional 2',3'-cyclic-nucleotide 2'-phosphodiesterase/3'-nucleotidase [Methylocystis sp.]|nr:bifunctional 2',3'-cyclic-nucleotide 2'-phosphodiesterase/3'-nucleotidase [Methylocystis sp.]MCA3582273.1 bifunctional 2',3'-cyclic-nucleotide 2'-phosphodiesterase/3'-nucleotidase [Methylocystis sp.]MCA3588168.1 bifunctional 2',3'-cyclic-nucleotide 2'-phosphodiesterase/3'-nucleotidase [Methylocystis sp.]MCA3590086.1 bifunctional 2',3'-cyclic-nucleotide 2'-phosphodiesterase/3'-nucleotidase [Methylocystis sp.]